MKFKTLIGKLKDVNIMRLKIDWSEDFGSKFEKEVAEYLYQYWKNDFVVTQFPIPSTRLSIDFFNVTRRIAIEVQGDQHQRFVKFLSGSQSGYLAQIKRDFDKAKFCANNEIKLVEVLPIDMPLNKKFFKDKYGIDL